MWHKSNIGKSRSKAKVEAARKNLALARKAQWPDDPMTRFWKKVNRNGPLPDRNPELGPCWLWTGVPNNKGYGEFFYDGSIYYAHRFSYLTNVGEIPEGMELDHGCDTPACVRPDHLRPMTHRENTLRGRGIAALNALKTHCPAGHEYDHQNTFLTKNGGRVCRTCHRENEKIRQRRIRKATHGATA